MKRALTGLRLSGYHTKMEVCPAFIDETGVLSGPRHLQPLYGIGALVVPDNRVATNRLYRLHFNFSAHLREARRRIRDQVHASGQRPTLDELDSLMSSTRHHEYKFNNITLRNVQQYIDLLNLYFEFPEMQFHALVMDRMSPEYTLARWNGDIWQAYADLTRGLLELKLDRDVFAIMDLQDKPDNSSIYLEDIICAAPAVKGCLRAASETSVYLQIVDLLLGCVQFDWKDAKGYYSATSGKAAAKREVTNFVKSRLGLRPAEAFLANGVAGRSWHTPSLFTINRGNWQPGA